MTTPIDYKLVNPRRVAILSLLLSVYTLVVQFHQYYGMGSILGGLSGSRLLRISPVLIVAGLDVLVLFLLGSKHKEKFMNGLLTASATLGKIRIVDWIFFSLIALVFPFFVLSPAYADFAVILTKLWIFGHLILLGSFFLNAAWTMKNEVASLTFTAVIYGMITRAALYLPDISNQMTSLGWSEASRYYYASLYFAKSIYGVNAPLSSLHPTRYLLQSIPFLIQGLPIWVHRAWQVILWLALPLIGSILISRRLPRQSRWLTLVVILWGFLFLDQGPVYYHLMVCIILVYAGFSEKKPLRSLVFVILASIWAGISRINWFPVPGFLAAFLYVLETPRSIKTVFRYWLWPVIWISVGLVSAFLSQAAFIALSGIPAENFGSSFTSSLLWYRLLPNITYPQGVLPSIILVSLPGIVVIVIRILQYRAAIHAERLAFILLTLFVFFAGGIVVSVKIGGGSNLHNLDAFLVFLLISTLHFYFRAVNSESGIGDLRPIPWYVTALVVFIPLLSVVRLDAKIIPFDNQPVIADIQELQAIIDSTPVSEGEVLFITQRQFLTFGYVKGVRLVPDYEKVYLMEMAMADNQDYFSQFEADLQNHRFSLIITEPLSYIIQGEQDVFSEENNAWTTHVVTLIRRYYHETTHLPAAMISIAVPNNP